MIICYFGTYNRDFSRNKIYMRALRARGHTVIECADRSPGFSKYIRLFKTHWHIRRSYDVMVVGYPGHIVVPFAKLISARPVVLDALCPLSDGMISSRAEHPSVFYCLKIFITDWLAFRLADMVLVESKHQQQYVALKYSVPMQNIRVVFTSADDSIFFSEEKGIKRNKFTAIFRGKFLPEAGMKYILNAAKIVENEDISFLIVGNGFLEKEVAQYAEEEKLKNVEFVVHYLSDLELRDLMRGAHASLGQFADHERLSRTIPHKVYESLALRLPYITSRALGIEELLTDGETCLFTNPADATDLAQKIRTLKNDRTLSEKLAREGYRLFQEKLSPQVVGEELEHILSLWCIPR